MARPELTEEDHAALARFVRELIDAERIRLSPRMTRLRALLAKLDPPAETTAAPLPAPRVIDRSQWLRRRKNRRR